jgi:ABC-type uncharacterized transport system auxiliary subunit
MKTRVMLLTFLAAGVLCGCSEKIQTVEYYVNHPEEADRVKQACEVAKAHPQNCKNAANAFMVQRDKAKPIQF